jgi:hypothetical protein
MQREVNWVLDDVVAVSQQFLIAAASQQLQ